MLAEKEKTKRQNELPKAVSDTAPATAVRLTIFGSSNVVNHLNETDLITSCLGGVPVRLIPAARLSEFREKIEMVCSKCG